jgi:hypothetical protein
MINKQNAAATLSSGAGTHQTGSPCTDNHNINISCHHHFAQTILKPKTPKTLFGASAMPPATTDTPNTPTCW